jgi:hypothetical protein
MRLTNQQSYELLEKHRVFAREICDKCGTVLGAVRFTRRGQPVTYCSRECRESQWHAIRKGRRPIKYESEEQRRIAKTRQQRDYRLRPGVEKTPSQIGRNKELKGANNDTLAVLPYPDISALKQPLGEHEVG